MKAPGVPEPVGEIPKVVGGNALREVAEEDDARWRDPDLGPVLEAHLPAPVVGRRLAMDEVLDDLIDLGGADPAVAWIRPPAAPPSS